VKVASTEEFQSLEKKALFISTVRSSRSYNSHDRKYQLGMLNNPKRLNTSITRAVALLVVVGDPYILCQDEHWKHLLE
jgi:superfamily I DNA and/or RNA helicase